MVGTSCASKSEVRLSSREPTKKCSSAPMPASIGRTRSAQFSARSPYAPFASVKKASERRGARCRNVALVSNGHSG
eukprot:5293737-Prymnesium_polylepis.1